MESGRPIVAAVGLFFGGLIVGSSPGVTREGNAAHAATSSSAEPKNAEPRGRSRGPIAPALSRIMAESSRGEANVEPPRWSRDRAEHRDPNDPFAGLVMPELPVPPEPEVLKYLRYFSESYDGRKIFAEGLRRSGRYQDVIAKVFREAGLPKELMAVAFIESGFNTDAVSSAGASGMWQFMPATARAYGLTIDDRVDERSGIWTSTEAAAHHLSDLYARFKSWELALAAYNYGYDGLDRRLDDMEADDFWALADTPGGLPNETIHYVPKVMAAAVVFANLDKLGFSDVELAAPVDAAEIDVPPDTKLQVLARAAGTSLRALRELNPELLGDVVPDRNGRAAVHVPKAGASRARTMLPRLASDDPETLRVSEDFDWGHDDAKTGRTRLERTAAVRDSIREPRRRKSRRTDRALPTVREERHEKNDIARADDRPDEVRKTKRVEQHDEPAPREEPKPTRKMDLVDEEVAHEEPRSEPVATLTAPSTRIVYRVKAGDSLAQIAVTVGLTIDQLLAQVHAASAADIQVGQVLEIRVPAKPLPPLPN